MREIKTSTLPTQHLGGIIAALIGLGLSAYVGGWILTLALIFVGFAAVSLAHQRIPIERFERIEAELQRLEAQISQSELRTNDRVRLIESQIQQTRLDIDKLKVELYIPKSSPGLGLGAMSAVLLALVVVGIGVLRWWTVPADFPQLVQTSAQQSAQQSSPVVSNKIPAAAVGLVLPKISTVSQTGETTSGELHKIIKNAPFLIPSQQRTVNFIYRSSANSEETPRASLNLVSNSVLTSEHANLLAEQRWNSRNSVAFCARGASAVIERLDPLISMNTEILSSAVTQPADRYPDQY